MSASRILARIVQNDYERILNCKWPKHVSNYFLIPLRGVEAITWQNFVRAKSYPGNTEERSRLARMKPFTCNYSIYT